MATVVNRTRLNVTLYVNCLSSWNRKRSGYGFARRWSLSLVVFRYEARCFKGSDERIMWVQPRTEMRLESSVISWVYSYSGHRQGGCEVLHVCTATCWSRYTGWGKKKTQYEKCYVRVFDPLRVHHWVYDC